MTYTKKHGNMFTCVCYTVFLTASCGQPDWKVIVLCAPGLGLLNAQWPFININISMNSCNLIDSYDISGFTYLFTTTLLSRSLILWRWCPSSFPSIPSPMLSQQPITNLGQLGEVCTTKVSNQLVCMPLGSEAVALTYRPSMWSKLFKILFPFIFPHIKLLSLIKNFI